MHSKVVITVPNAQNTQKNAQSVQWDQTKSVCRTAPATLGRLQIYRVSQKKGSFRKTTRFTSQSLKLLLAQILVIKKPPFEADPFCNQKPKMHKNNTLPKKLRNNMLNNDPNQAEKD